MSSDSSETLDRNELDGTKKMILLPLEYVLECWKVKDGTMVRSGETVALACLENSKMTADESSSTFSAHAAAAEEKHKRPSRRKRPTCTMSQTTDKKDGEQLSNIKLPSSQKVTSNGGSGKQIDSKPDGILQLKSIPIEAPISGIVRIGKTENDANIPGAIGFIELCSHPTVVNNMCAVCGIPMGEISNSFDTKVTVSGGLTFAVSKQEGIRMGMQNTQRLRQLKKLSLVLDLDATLVHATGDTRAREHLSRNDVRSILLPGTEHATTPHFYVQHFVKLRPNVKEFLEGVRDGFEIGVYTAGTRQYAEQIAIILCRHLVGAERDQTDLDQLRQLVVNAANELVVSQAAKPFRKKQKVTFAESQPPEGTLTITAERLLELETELKKAEEEENRALELKQKIFGSRIVSRSDVGDLGRDVKSLKRIFPCGGTMAAVVDDREDVWANAEDNISNASNSRPGEPPENLLLVEAYHWQPFTGFTDINNASGLSLAKQSYGKQDDALDEQLIWTKDILNRLHTRYYSQNSDDGNIKTVPQILGDMRKEVLSGKNVVLSGLVPLHRQTQYNGVRRPDAIRYVETMGGKICSTVDADTSYVVAAIDGTEKILAARRNPGCFVVKRSWLMQCYWSITLRDPMPHLWPSTGTEVTAGCVVTYLSPVRDVIAAAQPNDQKDEDSDEDDTLADMFEKEFL